MKRFFALMLTALLLALPALAACETIVTIGPAPDQTAAQRPPCFPDPADD